MRVLYVSYNGILEPIGRSQVFRYVVAQGRRHEFVILSFERPSELADTEKRAEVAASLAAVGATWLPVTYFGYKPRFIAAALNFLNGGSRVLLNARRHKIEVLHARSYLGALLVLPAHLLWGIPYLFDMRGFWPDEGVGVGRWAEGSFTHRALKALERVLLRRAGALVTLTESGARHLSQNFPDVRPGCPIVVVPTCADLARFQPPPEAVRQPMVLGYAGSANEAYLFREFLLTFLALRRRIPEARMLILNRKDHRYIQDEMARLDIPPELAEIRAVDHDDVPAQMRRMTVGTIFVYPYAAKIGSAPTKMAEFLATGVPCLGNDGCGDVSDILEHNQVGISIARFEPDQIETMIDRLLVLLDDQAVASRCRAVALEQFSLSAACERYDRLYTRLRSASLQGASASA